MLGPATVYRTPPRRAETWDVVGPFRQGANLVHVADLRTDEDYLRGEHTPNAAVELGGVRTALAVPLRKDDALLGFINVYRQEVRPFCDRQIALLQNFAAQAVIAMENARLIDRAARGTGTTDCDGRGVAGDQRLAR